MDETRKAEFRRAFSLFDKNGDGHISSSELSQVMKQLGQKMSDEDLQKMLKEVDTDNSGSIEFEEFCVYMCNRMKPANPDDIKRKTFNACDSDNDGLIGPEEFVQVMKRLGDDTITLEQARGMIKRTDKDGNEKISYDEFLEILKGSTK